MDTRGIALYVEADPTVGGGYSYWQAILHSLSDICQKNGWKLFVFSSIESWRQEAKKYGVEYVNSSINKIQAAENLLIKKICTKEQYLNKIGTIIPYLGRAVTGNIKLVFSSRPSNKLHNDLGIDQVCPIWDLMHIYEPQFKEVNSSKQVYLRNKKFTDICISSKIVLVDSEVGREQIIESYGDIARRLEEKIEILPFIPAAYIFDGDEEVCTELKFAKFVFYPAQFWSHKNHIRLIKAIKKLKEEGLVVNLVLVGAEKNSYSDVITTIKELKLERQIQIMGFVPDREMVYLYRRARLLCMPTFFGPTNIPPLEAFALGCPVAISGIYATPEQVGDAALLFDPNSVDEIADCIKMLWTDDGLCADLIQKGFAKTKSWGQEQFTNRLEEIIEKVFRGQNESV